jgi:arylsulfatase A-like enzyme
MGRARAADRLNFLVILTDDQAFRAIGYNNPLVHTPHLDTLATQGLIFDRAFIATPICLASRASLLTGVYPQQHGSVGLDPEGFQKNAIQAGRFRTLPCLLEEAGYLCGFSGKSHLGDPLSYGFDRGSEFRTGSDDETFAYASSFLRERGEDRNPFLLWVATRQPHVPLQPEEKWLEPYRNLEIPLDPNFLESPPEGSLYNQGLPGERFYRDSNPNSSLENPSAGPPRGEAEMRSFIRKYYATITRLDSQVGNLIADLKREGLAENTIFFFLSDNGYQLGNHGLGNKITMLEESVRVPMFVSWRGLPKKGVRTESLVSSLDLPATVLDLAGAEKPTYLEGRSLAPFFENPDHQLRETVFSECVGVGGKPGMGHRMVRSERWKLVLTDEEEFVLFDMKNDPYELNDLSDQPENQEVLKELKNQLKVWMKRVGDRQWPEAPNQD